MFRTAPEFWKNKSAITSAAPDLLVPFSVIYYLFNMIRDKYIKKEKVSKPVICVGNFVAGGAGKTPTCIAIAKILIARGKKVVFISRGYGGFKKGNIKVDLNSSSHNEVGDEPLLLSRIAPTWVGNDYVSLANATIESENPDIIIMDDGFHNPRLIKDFAILVIDGEYGFGNGFVLPAGPLRAPVGQSLDKARAVICIGEDKQDVIKFVETLRPVFFASLEPVKGTDVTNMSLVAFAGIGRPEKFFNTLRSIGANIADEVKFEDHYSYSSADMESLKQRAENLQAKLITTEKDFVRIPEEYKNDIMVLPVEVRFEDSNSLLQIIESQIATV